MTSQINPNNIDGTYPVAGQDNDSQGFRDNFTNTKTNFSYAAAEITDLQSKAVLKAPLNGTTLNNNMGGSVLSNAQLQDMSETKVALGTQSGDVTINYQAGPFYTLTTSGSVSLGFSNWPAAGTVGRVRVQITISSTSNTVTIPAAVTVGIFNTCNLDGSIMTFPFAGTFEYEFETSDGGSTVTIRDLTFNRDPVYLPSSEDLAPSAAVDLGVTNTYFTTTTAETATMAAGYPGLVKNLIMAGFGGNMVITVANAGWKSSGSGTITFNAIGDACSLIFINNKWYVTGNNSVVLA